MDGAGLDYIQGEAASCWGPPTRGSTSASEYSTWISTEIPCRYYRPLKRELFRHFSLPPATCYASIVSPPLNPAVEMPRRWCPQHLILLIPSNFVANTSDHMLALRIKHNQGTFPFWYFHLSWNRRTDMKILLVFAAISKLLEIFPLYSTTYSATSQASLAPSTFFGLLAVSNVLRLYNILNLCHFLTVRLS